MGKAGMSADKRASEIRAELGHPVIDADGHWVETLAVFLEYLDEVGGPKAVDGCLRMLFSFQGAWYGIAPEERLAKRIPRPNWWPVPSRTDDLATAALPALMCERLDEFGIDFSVIYPTLGFAFPNAPDAELRGQLCRAYNEMAADQFRPFSTRMTPAAIIPTTTSDEAVAELDHAVGELGLKAIMVNGFAMRPIATDAGSAGVGLASQVPYFVDFLAIDSVHDYEPFWARCVDHAVAVTSHGASLGWSDRRSPTSYVFNHIGMFSAAGHGFARAVVLGGVCRRHPSLRFAFLEGGVGYGANLFSDLVGHWNIRNVSALDANLRPLNVDVSRLEDLWNRYAGERHRGKFHDALLSTNPFQAGKTLEELTVQEESSPWFDELAEIADPSLIATWFGDNLFFGCEADDPTVRWAFDGVVGTCLNPVFSSDIGHFDVPDMALVLNEAYELCERGLLDAGQFERFTFANAALLHGSMNPAFFDGTAVEDAVAGVLAGR